MSLQPQETAAGAEYGACRQLNIFLENQVGALVRLTRLLDKEPIRILGLSVEGKVDCAVLRLLVDDPDAAAELCIQGGLPVAQSEILVVELPPGKRGIITVCAALLRGELNINYGYTVWATRERVPCLAMQVDHLTLAGKILSQAGFHVLSQSEL